MLKGLMNIPDSTGGEPGSIRQLRLRDGDFVVLSFLSEGDEMTAERFHTTQVQTPFGTKFRQQRCTFESDGKCQLCSEGVDSRVLIFGWCWVFAHYRAPESLPDGIDRSEWKKVKVLNKIYYKDEVNGPMIFVTSQGRNQYLKSLLIQYYTDSGTLLTGVYKWSRTGTKLDTQYTLTKRNDDAVPPEVKDAREHLPSLEAVVKGDITSFEQEPNGVETEEEESKPTEEEKEPKSTKTKKEKSKKTAPKQQSGEQEEEVVEGDDEVPEEEMF